MILAWLLPRGTKHSTCLQKTRLQLARGEMGKLAQTRRALCAWRTSSGLSAVYLPPQSAPSLTAKTGLTWVAQMGRSNSRLGFSKAPLMGPDGDGTDTTPPQLCWRGREDQQGQDKGKCLDSLQSPESPRADNVVRPGAGRELG